MPLIVGPRRHDRLDRFQADSDQAARTRSARTRLLHALKHAMPGDHGLFGDTRGGITLLAALMFPFMLGVALLGVDGSRAYFHKLLLRQSAQAGSLAGANQLATYYTTNSSNTIVAAAQQFAGLNMPSGKYGTVVPASDVVLGNWDLTTKTFTSLAASGGTTPNAVSVTARSTSANGNALSTLFGTSVGKSSVDLTTTAISSYATGYSFHVIVINDLSGSFSSSIANQRAADKAILDCVKNSAGTSSQFGLIGITGHYTVTQAPIVASTNYDALVTKINGVKSCGNSGAPSCSGSNVASGIYRATKSDMFANASYANTYKNIVIITDGVPNADSFTYTREDGIYPTPSSPTPTCTSSCTDSKLLTMAQNQANYANTLGVSISTIYYSGSTPSNQQAGYAASLATLRKGTGISLIAPTQSKISSSFAAFCATMSSKLMAMY